MERDLSGDPRSAAMDESTEVKEKREEDSSMEMTEQTLAGENAFVDPGGTASKATNPSSSSVNDNSESDDEGADELQIEALESSLAENPFNYEAHVQDSQTKSSKPPPPKDEEDSGEEDDEEEDDEEHGNTLCGDCGGNYATDEFWICCDICEKWFHGKCVKITPARAEQIKQYECPACSNNKRARA